MEGCWGTCTNDNRGWYRHEQLCELDVDVKGKRPNVKTAKQRRFKDVLGNQGKKKHQGKSKQGYPGVSEKWHWLREEIWSKG